MSSCFASSSRVRAIAGECPPLLCPRAQFHSHRTAAPATREQRREALRLRNILARIAAHLKDDLCIEGICMSAFTNRLTSVPATTRHHSAVVGHYHVRCSGVRKRKAAVRPPVLHHLFYPSSRFAECLAVLSYHHDSWRTLERRLTHLSDFKRLLFG